MHGADVDRRRGLDVNRAVRRVGSQSADHGEGPFWDSREQRLLIVDLMAGDILELREPDAPERYHLGTVAAALRARAGGGFVVALENGFALTDARFDTIDVLPPVFTDPAIRMNDGGCDPQGRFYCGTMAYDESSGAGTLFRLDPDLTVHTVLEGVTISNGLQWSADGSTVFYNDTATGRVDVFDFEAASGTFSGRRPFASIPPSAGAPPLARRMAWQLTRTVGCGSPSGEAAACIAMTRMVR